MFAFERVIALYHCPATTLLVGRRRKLILSVYNYHGPKPCLLASGLQPTIFTVRSQAHLIWEEEKTSRAIYITVQAVLALWWVATICHCPVTTRLWRRRRSYCFVSLYPPSLYLVPCLSTNRVPITVRSLARVRLDDFHRRQWHRSPGLPQHHRVQGLR